MEGAFLFFQSKKKKHPIVVVGSFNHDVDHAKEVPLVSELELLRGQSMVISCPHVLHIRLFSCVVVCPFYV